VALKFSRNNVHHEGARLINHYALKFGCYLEMNRVTRTVLRRK